MPKQKRTRNRIVLSAETYDRLDQLSRAFWHMPVPLVVAELARINPADFRSMMVDRVNAEVYGSEELNTSAPPPRRTLQPEPQAGPASTSSGPATNVTTLVGHTGHGPKTNGPKSPHN